MGFGAACASHHVLVMGRLLVGGRLELNVVLPGSRALQRGNNGKGVGMGSGMRVGGASHPSSCQAASCTTPLPHATSAARATSLQYALDCSAHLWVSKLGPMRRLR